MADNRKTVLITGETIADLKEAGAEPLSLTVDNEESLQSCYKEVCALTGDRGLDYLVNNA
ncbi:hypothetical protein KEM55_008410, partial [Ascosphaera atra]